MTDARGYVIPIDIEMAHRPNLKRAGWYWRIHEEGRKPESRWHGPFATESECTADIQCNDVP